MRIALLLIVLLLTAAPGAAEEVAPSPEAVDAAVARAVDYLWAQRRGVHWERADAPPADRPIDWARFSTPGAPPREFGGRTALACYALLTAGANPRDERMVAALEWLIDRELEGVYARSLRALALAELPGGMGRAALRADAAWLLRAARDDGAYGYTAGGDDGWDNANTQIALFAVRAAAAAGVETPPGYYRRVERHWLACQGGRGGWSYDRASAAPSGAMTAGALASLMICREMIGDEAVLTCRARGDDEPLRRGLSWLAENFSVYDNPGKGPLYVRYWLLALQRAALAGGYKYIGAHDWFAAGAAELLRSQRPDGSWGDVTETCFAAAFLSRGARPMLLSKLQYDGAWNPRPRDAANLVDWLGRRFERPMRWQVLPVDAPAEQWADAPILYISGASPPQFSDEQLARIRRFVLAGGMILSEAACNSPTFNAEMTKIYQRLFPDRPLLRLAADHPVYTLAYGPDDPPVLMGVDGGARLWAVHSPTDLSRPWHFREHDARAAAFDQAANLFYYVTETGRLRHRALAEAPAEPAQTPESALRIVRLRHGGAWDPEPAARAHLSAEAARAHLALRWGEPTRPDGLDFEHCDAALLSGAEAVEYDPAEIAALIAFVRAGGVLITDAAGGADAFDDWVRDELLPALGPRAARPLRPDSDIWRRPGREIDRVQYRPATAAIRVGEPTPELLAGYADGPAILHSRYDLTAGVAGVRGYHIRGLDVDSARAVMVNLLLHAADRVRRHRESRIDVQWRPDP